MRCDALWGIKEKPLHYIVEFTREEVLELIENNDNEPISTREGSYVRNKVKENLGEEIFDLIFAEYERAERIVR